MAVTLRELSSDWSRLAQEYRPSAFWFWNGAMEPERMRHVVETMAANRVREFLIHPIHGLEIEYLSELFFERVGLALELAKKHALKVWIYDEYGWPSGNVAGKLLDAHPEYNGWFLHFSHDGQGRVAAKPRRCNKIMDNTMGAPWSQNQKGQLDTLRDEAVACYLKMCHEEYYRRFAGYFGSTIVGFFTDEPTAMTPDFTEEEGNHWHAPALPWTPEFPALFRKKFNYDIEPLYTQLAQDGFVQAREDYWTLVKEIHSRAYHEQIGVWCRKHGVQYTGHLGEDALLMQVRYAGSVFQTLRHMDVPGIDQLLYKDDTDQRDISQMVITSVTRHAGKERTFCEAWGISPFDLRMSRMTHQMQMFAIHGVNDVALMGFHQQLDGVRRYVYWPPMFDSIPGWPWFNAFREAGARHLALGSLAPRRARYAILYPQRQLEQTSPFVKSFDPAYPPKLLLDKIAQAIYAAGESFEFVFDEILDQAQVKGDGIHFTHAVYETLIAPEELMYYPRNRAQLEDLKKARGKVFDGTTKEIVTALQEQEAGWSKDVGIEHDGAAGALRVFQFAYPDGTMLALRNVTEEALTVTLKPRKKILTLWEAQDGKLEQVDSTVSLTVAGHTGLWFSLTDKPAAAALPRRIYRREYLPLSFSVAHEKPNLAPLDKIEFLKDTQWVAAEDTFKVRQPYAMLKSFVPLSFAGREEIPFRGEFNCRTKLAKLEMAFEKAHLRSLQVNERTVNLTETRPVALWDHSCMMADISDYLKAGRNTVSGVLTYQPFETQIRGDLFYGFVNPQVSCDVFAAGDFRLINGVIEADAGQEYSLPLRLQEAGLVHSVAAARLRGTLALSAEQAKRAYGLELHLFEPDAVEVFCDGQSLGHKVHGPYIFALPEMHAGKHELTIRLAPTAGQLFYREISWGVRQVDLLLQV